MANTTDKSILTAAGKALLAQLNAEEKPLIIDKMIFANVPNRPEYPQPDDVVPTDHIVHQEQVEQRGRLSADSVIYSTTLTSDVGPFDFNWTGAYCSEYGVLVTIDHHALTPKTADQPGVAGNTLVRSVVLEYKDIAEITNITVDASSWQYNATPRMKKMDDDVAQAIIDQNGKDWFIGDGFLVTPQASAFNIKAGAGYVSGNRVTLEFDRNVQVPNKPSFIYIDAHREGTPTGEQVTLFDFVITADEKDDYTDANEVKHFVCKIAQVLGDGSASDLRPEDLNKENWKDGRKITHPGKIFTYKRSAVEIDCFASDASSDAPVFLGSNPRVTAGIDANPVVVKNIKQMIGAMVPHGAKISTKGFFEPGEGAAEYTYSNDVDKSDHNGSTIIDPDVTDEVGSSKWYEQKDTLGKGCFVKILKKGEVNLSECGAKEGEDVSEIIESIYRVNKRIKIVATKRYELGDIYVADAHVIITGKDVGILSLKPSAKNYGTFENCPTFSVYRMGLEDVTNPDRTQLEDAGFNLQNCPKIEIFGCTGNAMHYMLLNAQLPVTHKGLAKFKFDSNVFDGYGSINDGDVSYAAFCNVEGAYTKGSVFDNYMIGFAGSAFRCFPSYSDPVTLSDESVPEHWIFYGNTIKHCKRPSDGEGSAIYYRGHNLLIEANTLELCGRNIVDVQGPSNQTIAARNIRVFKNNFLNKDTFMSSAASALLLLRCCESTVCFNEFLGGGDGIQHNGVYAKWGGSLVAQGNKFPNKNVNGFDHTVRGSLIGIQTSDAINNLMFYEVNITGNEGFTRFAASSLIDVTSNSDQLIPTVVVEDNTVTGNGMLIGLTDLKNNKRIRKVKVGAGNNIDSAGGLTDSSYIDVPFIFKPYDFGFVANSELPGNAPKGSTAFAASTGKPAWFYNNSWLYADGSQVIV